MVCCQPGSKPVAAQSTYCQLDSVGTSFGYLKKRKEKENQCKAFAKWQLFLQALLGSLHIHKSMTPLRYSRWYPAKRAYAWQIGPFWQDTLVTVVHADCSAYGWVVTVLARWSADWKVGGFKTHWGCWCWDATDAIPMALSNRLASRAMTTDDRPNSFVFSYLLHHVHGPRLIDQSVAMQIRHALSPGQNTEQPLRVDIKRSTQM